MTTQQQCDVQLTNGQLGALDVLQDLSSPYLGDQGPRSASEVAKGFGSDLGHRTVADVRGWLREAVALGLVDEHRRRFSVNEDGEVVLGLYLITIMMGDCLTF